MVRGSDQVLIWAVDEAILSRSDFEADRITSASVSTSYVKEFIPYIASDGLTP